MSFLNIGIISTEWKLQFLGSVWASCKAYYGHLILKCFKKTFQFMHLCNYMKTGLTNVEFLPDRKAVSK